MTRSEFRRLKIEPKLLYQQDPLRKSLLALGAKWTLLILRDIGYLKLNRFGQIMRNNPGLAPRVLSRRLQQMQQEGLIKRAEREDKVEYRITSRGEDAFYILLAFLRYGLKYHGAGKKEQERLSLADLLKTG
jgi:DNA-binding HxlR family transcriptional regulator